ncbi:MAG: DivIVA domain-containing protein [Acidipropionibacterium acidipropionici]|jgi:DivIVA domain-containing protein|uniref:DivIVA domain-containing protein n=1 Tax=Acidipropionibacterium acidipropionici TaxID=1748 RepID=UPI002F35714B
MVWVLSAVVIVIIGAAVMAASGRFGAVPPVVDDRPAPDLPEGDLGPDDLRSARFAVVARGYSMAQVDAMMDRLASQLGQAPAEATDQEQEEEPAEAVEDPGKTR